VNVIEIASEPLFHAETHGLIQVCEPARISGAKGNTNGTQTAHATAVAEPGSFNIPAKAFAKLCASPGHLAET
jgi:hypothetical protein